MPAELRSFVGRRVERRVSRTLRWADDQFELSRGTRKLLDHIFPDHWSFVLGEIALYSFVVLVGTGVFLALYFDPSTHTFVYHGPVRALDGTRVSAAYASAVDLSVSVRSGLLFRQMHHWAADVFLGAIVVHLMRVFFTGAFRKPRATNWVIGATMFFVAIFEGYAGYSMPDDVLSGAGLRIGYSIIESIPVVGSYLAVFLFHGQYPGNGAIEQRFFIAHVFLLPAVIAALLGVHLVLIFKQKHTQFPGKGRTEENVVGSPMFPNFTLKSVGLLFMTAGVLALLGGLVQDNPVFQYGHYETYKVSYAAQPDWYLGWIEGAMRLTPGWEFQGFGHEIPFNLFFPAVVLPAFTYFVMIAWPAIESAMTGDRRQHQLLDRPRDNAVRTSIGAGILAFYALLFIASSDDLIASFFDVPLQGVVLFFQVVTPLLPWLVGYVAYRVCADLRRPREAAGTLVLMGDHYVLEEPPPQPDGELEPEEVPPFVLTGPIPSSVPRPVEHHPDGETPRGMNVHQPGGWER